MKTGKRKVLRVVLCILALFILLNVSWYVWRTVKYGSYSKGWEKNYFSTWLVPRYIYTDADRYDYGVKYPEYLSLTGNLSVGFPTTDENPFTDFLIVWPKFTGGYEYGVSITEGNEAFQIYINADGSVVDQKDSEFAARNKEIIDDLLNRAKEVWDLK